jgi:hypothetical protein
MIPQLILCDDNTMEPSNTCELQNELLLNNDKKKSRAFYRQMHAVLLAWNTKIHPFIQKNEK